jgi:threonine dehydrogenase-like Zn-dependent dehydrogenase
VFRPIVADVPSSLEKIESGAFDPSYVISHRIGLDEPPDAFKAFRDRKEECTKVVITP